MSIRAWQRLRSHKTTGDAEGELNRLVEAGSGRWAFPPQVGRGRPAKRFLLHSDTSDTDKNPADGPETGIVSVSELSDGANSSPDADAGCPVGERPPDEMYATCPEAQGWTPAVDTDADAWGEI